MELPFLGVPTTNWTSLIKDGPDRNGLCLYGKGNTQQGPSFDLEVPDPKEVLITGRCLNITDNIWGDMDNCSLAENLGTFAKGKLERLGLNLTISFYYIQKPKKGPEKKGQEQDRRETHLGPRCNTGPGYWWLCGDGRVRKSLPQNWKGHCVWGYLAPQISIFEGALPPRGFLRTPWLRVKRTENPLIIEGTRYHSFVRWLIPSLGVSELEKAIVNISATLEVIEKATIDAIQGLQLEIQSLSKVVLQNRMGLDMLLAKEGGLCVVINQTCCTYISQNQRIETDLEEIWEKTRILHEASQDDTSWDLTDILEKLASWLPDLTWLKQLFVTIIIIILLSVVLGIVVRCGFLCCRSTGVSYSEWKKNQLRRKLETNKYFEKMTMKERAIPVLFLAVMMVAGVDGEDLDDNVMTKMMDINISRALELTWEQYQNGMMTHNEHQIHQTALPFNFGGKR
ncbi:LOW QUALITY PROTEIN: endogenous retrovirus group V member 2 Env polyprotein-like [Aquila chrysaetos chrysaetos]|uniref:LOW QUALITY PROTEIN: endogenous retrovirus group V member 2 Env polyprotein-like n=1 Tax=Aquila chrysaetos chrysaetos TaxID=223781 RepID=UPI001B7D454E|nr:LOW QUALITY PROTEIN: endogenous retrovirus group V member 2 Env polyprotein-like [Aquila chrysaetos chrysaetos]